MSLSGKLPFLGSEDEFFYHTASEISVCVCRESLQEERAPSRCIVPTICAQAVAARQLGYRVALCECDQRAVHLATVNVGDRVYSGDISTWTVTSTTLPILLHLESESPENAVTSGCDTCH